MSESRGVYVAFDGDGKHFAYAAHPKTIEETPGLSDPAFERKQQEACVANYRSQARRLGGKVLLLSPEEYKDQVLDHPENMRDAK